MLRLTNCHFLFCFIRSTAQASAQAVYRPLFLGNTVLYLLLRYSWWGRSGLISLSSLVVFLVLGALQYYSYVGILDAHAVAATVTTASVKQTSSNSQNSSNSSSNNALIGGHALDIWGLTVVVQYGSLFFSAKFYYLLAILPLWGAWTLYAMVRGSRHTGTTRETANHQPMREEKDPTVERRKQRAEKRRQKWT